jgi:hypothetical protein
MQIGDLIKKLLGKQKGVKKFEHPVLAHTLGCRSSSSD